MQELNRTGSTLPHRSSGEARRPVNSGQSAGLHFHSRQLFRIKGQHRRISCIRARRRLNTMRKAGSGQHAFFECDSLVTEVSVGTGGAMSPSKPTVARKERREVLLPAFVLLENGTTISVNVLDLSYDGCRIDLGLPLQADEKITLSVLGLGVMPAYVRWCSGGLAGLCFRAEPIDPVAETPRQHERVSLKAQISLRRAGRANFVVQTTDVSPTGCRVEFVDRPSVGERHFLKFEGLEVLEAKVRWVKGFSAGVEFTRPIYPPVFELLVARLR